MLYLDIKCNFRRENQTLESKIHISLISHLSLARLFQFPSLLNQHTHTQIRCDPSAPDSRRAVAETSINRFSYSKFSFLSMKNKYSVTFVGITHGGDGGSHRGTNTELMKGQKQAFH